MTNNKGLRGLLLGHLFVEHAHDVGLLHDQEVLAVDLHESDSIKKLLGIFCPP